MPRNHNKRGKKAGGPPKKPLLTHFICVPLVTATSRPQFETSLSKFKEDVCREHSAQGNALPLKAQDIETSSTDKGSKSPEDDDEGASASTISTRIAEKAIRPAGVLHLTLGVMSLDDTSLALAISLLKDTDIVGHLESARSKDSLDIADPLPSSGKEESIFKSALPLDSLTRPISPPEYSRNPAPAPILVQLKGLVSMHPAHKTSILYTAPADLSSRLQPLCESLKARFQSAGLLVEDTRPLKLHATIVNTIYAKGRKARPKGRGKSTGKVESESVGSKSITNEGDISTQDLLTEPTPVQSNASKAGQSGPPQEDDRSQGHGPNAKAPLRIDAREVLERYREFIWADNVVLDRIAICEMGAKKTLDEKGEVVKEEYKEVASISLPGAT